MTTRLELRQSLAQLIGDLTIGTVVSSSASGSSTLLVDTRRTEPDNNWKGAEIWVTSGAASGAASVVISSDESSTNLEVYPALTGLEVGVQYELHAIPLGDYHRVIGEAYNEVQHFALGKISTTGYSISTRELDVSTLATVDGWTHVYQLELDRGNGWEKIKHNQWRTVSEVHSIKFSEWLYGNYSGKDLRIRGYKQFDEPTTDAGTYELPRNGCAFVIHRAASLMLLSHPDWFDANQKGKISSRWESEASRTYHNMGTLLQGQSRAI